MKITRIVLIGAGNLATQLALALRHTEARIEMVWSLHATSAQTLGERIDAPWTTRLDNLPHDADLYLFAIKDDGLEGILRRMPYTGGIWAHTTGSVPMEIFAPYTPSYGVFYPLQTFSKARDVDFATIHHFIEGSTPAEADALQTLALQLSPHVVIANSAQRSHLHLAAVFCCNFVNHLYHISYRLLEDQQLAGNALLPLIIETAEKLSTLHPKAAQTGPAVRHDHATMQTHLDRLSPPELQALYQTLSNQIMQYKDE